VRTRRAFLVIAGAALGASAIGLGWLRLAAGARPRRIGLGGAAVLLLAHFDYLALEPGACATYVADLEARKGRLRPWQRLPDDFFTRFLLSTDYFARGSREAAAPVRYVAFYDPYERPCASPFARFDA